MPGRSFGAADASLRSFCHDDTAMIRDFSDTDTLGPSYLLANHQADLRLCFRGTERDGQVVRISANKCTIGSSPDCTLRLICPGVRPVHCLIIRGDGGMVIRRLSVDTLLNGKSFGDATLLPGDHLAIGPIEFDVLPEVPRAERPRGSDVTQAHMIADDPAPASSHAESHLRQATLLEREQELSRQQQEMDQARVEFDRRVPEWEGNCEQTRQDLAHARTEFDSQRTDWDAQRAEEQERLEQRARELEQESAAWQQEREQLRHDSGKLDKQQQDALDKLTRQVESLRAERDEARIQGTETQQKWQDSQLKLDKQLAATRPQIDLYEKANQSLSDELNAAQTKLKQFEDRHQDQQSLEDDLRQSQTRCDELTQELEETRQQKDRQEQAHQSLSNELNAAQVRLQEFESVVETRFENVTRELEVAQQERAQEQAEYEAARQKRQKQQDTPREEDDVTQTQDWVPQRSELSQQLDANESDLPELPSQQQHEQNETEEQLTASQEKIDEQWEQLRQAQTQLEQAHEQWQTQRELESSEKAVEDEAAAALANQRRVSEQESEQRQAEFDQSCAAFAEEREQWESQRIQQDNDLNDQRARLDREFNELQQLRESLRQQQAAAGVSGEQERQAQRQLIDQESDAHTNQVEDQRNLSSQPTVVNDVTVPQTVDNQLPPVQSESLSGAGETEQADFTADDNPTLVSEAPLAEEELTFSEPTETAPVNTAEILARFGHTIENDEQDIPGPELTQSVEHHESSLSGPSDEDDDALKVYGEADSIQDYMADLLQRVERGASPTKASAVTRATEPSEGEISTFDEAAPEIDPTTESELLDPSEFVPRAIAPEATSNLQALRAVANTSARSAIDKHQRQRLEQLALIFWGVAAVALTLGGATVVWVEDFFSFWAFASVGSLLVGGYSVFSALMYTLKAKFVSQAVPKMLAEKGLNTAMDEQADQESPAAAVDQVHVSSGSVVAGEDTSIGESGDSLVT